MIRLASCVFGVLVLLALAPAAQAMRCNGNLTHGGDYEFQVRSHCGEPFWTETHYKVETIGSREEYISREVQFTDWFYNFGASDFIVHVVFRDGQLASEEKLGRGVDEIGSACDPARFGQGLSSGEIVAYCGEPASRYAQAGVVARHVSAGVHGQDDDYREEWIYDLGGNFVYVAHLYNGHLNGVERRRR
jgi:Protein of unknown function (DUF2845)